MELGFGQWEWIGKQVGDDGKLMVVETHQVLRLLKAPEYDRRAQKVVGQILRNLGWKVPKTGKNPGLLKYHSPKSWLGNV